MNIPEKLELRLQRRLAYLINLISGWLIDSGGYGEPLDPAPACRHPSRPGLEWRDGGCKRSPRYYVIGGDFEDYICASHMDEWLEEFLGSEGEDEAILLMRVS